MEKIWKKWDTPHIIVILRNNPAVNVNKNVAVFKKNY